MPQNRTLLTTLGLICFALIGAALYLQHVKDMLPCPLCVIQRYAFLFAGTFCLIAASVTKPRVWTGLALISSLVGLGYVAKHLYVLANPGFSCGMDPMETILNKWPTAVHLPWLFQADGLCESAVDKLLGLSIPQWSAVWFVILTVTLIYALLRRRQ